MRVPRPNFIGAPDAALLGPPFVVSKFLIMMVVTRFWPLLAAPRAVSIHDAYPDRMYRSDRIFCSARSSVLSVGWQALSQGEPPLLRDGLSPWAEGVVILWLARLVVQLGLPRMRSSAVSA